MGDVMADVSLAFRDIAEERSTILDELGLEPGAYLVVTAHRAGNVDRPGAARAAGGAAGGAAAAGRASRAPAHARAARGGRPAGAPRRRDGSCRRSATSTSSKLARHARAVLTDSGGVQKEAYLLGRAVRDAARHDRVGRDRRGGLERARGPRSRRRAGGAGAHVRPRSDPSCTAAGTPPSAFARSLVGLHSAPMKIGVVGLGYVGLPLAVAFCEAGHEVVGVDSDARVVEALRAGPLARRGRAGRALAARSRERFHADARATPTWPRSTRSSSRAHAADRATASPTCSR